VDPNLRVSKQCGSQIEHVILLQRSAWKAFAANAKSFPMNAMLKLTAAAHVLGIPLCML
jgi:hypothetical protein